MPGSSDPLPQPPQHLSIDARNEGQRIDNFLQTKLKGVPRSRIYRCLRRGEVRVNKGRVKPDYRLRSGDVVRVPPLRLGMRGPCRAPGGAVLATLEASILHEDLNLIIVNKPAGLAVHGGSGRSYGVIEALRASRGPHDFLELVHRLDRETSGCLMIAKKRSVLTGLHGLLRDGQVAKHYLALVGGAWTGGEQRIDGALRANTLISGERVVRPDPRGKPSVTLLRPLQSTGVASLVEARTLTGRTHQIRVHSASFGHPVAGDPKYGETVFNRLCRRQGLRRMFLHASRIAYRDPINSKDVSYGAPLPAELRRVLESLGMHW